MRTQEQFKASKSEEEEEEELAFPIFLLCLCGYVRSWSTEGTL